MNTLRKTSLAALTVAILATGGLFSTTTSSNATMRGTPVEASTQDVIKIGHGHHHRRKWRQSWGYGHCFWIEKKFWDPYYGGYFYKPVKVCR